MHCGGRHGNVLTGNVEKSSQLSDGAVVRCDTVDAPVGFSVGTTVKRLRKKSSYFVFNC